MKDHQHDAGHYARKAKEYRARARATLDVRVRSALEAVAREYLRKANETNGTVPRQAGVQ